MGSETKLIGGTEWRRGLWGVIFGGSGPIIALRRGGMWAVGSNKGLFGRAAGKHGDFDFELEKFALLI